MKMALLTNDEPQWTFTDDQLNKLENIYRHKISGSMPLKMVAQIRQLTRALETVRAERGAKVIADSEAKIQIERLANWGTLVRENERLTEALREALIHLEFYGDERNYDGSPRLSAAGGRPWVNHVGAERAAKAADEVREALAAKC